MDIALKKAKHKRGKPTSQLLAELDAKYEAERAKNADYFQKLTQYLDESSNKSELSRKSIVGSIVQLKELSSNDNITHDDDSLSSESSHGVNESVNSNHQSVTELTAMNANNGSPLNKSNPYNKIISISNQLHIPDGFSILYYSSDSDAVKVKQLNEFNGYITDQLQEEMSKFYPKCEDVITDQSTNDITMNKQTFSHNFSQIFRKGRIFLNYVQLREAVSEFFKHWNLLSKTNGKNIRCSYSFTPGRKKPISDNIEVLNSKRQSTASLVKCPFQLK